jgi:hypothetical protein
MPITHGGGVMMMTEVCGHGTQHNGSHVRAMKV